VEPPKFKGNLDLDKYLEWIQPMDKIREAKGSNDEKSSKVASRKVTRYAPLGFENLKKQRAKEEKRKVNSHEKLSALKTIRLFSKFTTNTSAIECSHSSKTI